MEIKAEDLINPKYVIVDKVNQRLQAVAPAFQRIRELMAILSDEQLVQRLGNAEKIESIEKNEAGYLICTENYSMQINVKYLPQDGFCGPAKFELEFCQPVSRKF